MSPLAVSSAAPWSRVVFTTYALSLTFFETVVLDALTRARAREVTILSDLEGVRCSLGEKGVRGAGRDYQLEPVAVSGGVFHPKISAFVADDDAMLIVGSGNLTFGGWAGNLEVVEHLHPSFAASAFRDVADLFEALADHPHVRHAASETCTSLAQDLRRSATGRADRGDIRVLNGLTVGITGQLADWAQELGGATRLAAMSPYFDDGAGISGLAEALGVEDVHLHWNGKVASGSAPSWPQSTVGAVNAVKMAWVAEDVRPLHAKAYEIVCRNGRLLVSGSANASRRALETDGNVEAVVLRAYRDGFTSWGWTPTEAPSFLPNPDDASEADEPAVGVLRAQLSGETLQGWVLTPSMGGEATIDQLTSRGPERLGSASIGADGQFRLEAPDLERQAWNAGRLVLRVQNESGIAEGYVISSAAGAIARRAGPMAPRLFAFLGGSETPDDVIAVLQWILDDPQRLPVISSRAGNPANSPADSDGLVPVQDLTWTPPDTGSPSTHGFSDADHMARLVSQLRRVMRSGKPAYEPPAPPEAGEEDDKKEIKRAEADQRRHEEAMARSESLSHEFLVWTLEPEQVRTWGVFALELIVHMAQRLEWTPGIVRAWLAKVAGALPCDGFGADDRSLVAGALLSLVGPESAERIRATFFRLELSLDGPPPDVEDFPLYAFASLMDFESAWAQVGAVRSIPEWSADLVTALKAAPLDNASGFDNSPFPSLCPDQWPTLRAALTTERARRGIGFGGRDITACPRCWRALPSGQVQDYRRHHVATASNCCGRVIVFDRTLS